MSWFSKVLGTEKVIDNVFDKDKGLLTQVGQWVGHQSLSKEEKIIYDANNIKAIHAYSVATLAENTDRSKARRSIAIQWMQLQVWLIKMAILFILIDYLVIKLGQGSEYELTENIMAIAFSPMLWGITGAVSVFFFGSHALRSSKFGKDS
jgi:hypothetical protein